MRLWRRRATFAHVDLPQKCFISHSYQDTAARKKLLATLPPSVEPIVFPPISVAPHLLVSHPLIQAIDSSDGLIYLESAPSANSFWVAFERDYALRSGKRVYAYDPTRRTLTPDISAPLELNVKLEFGKDDRDAVDTVYERLLSRNFEVWRHGYYSPRRVPPKRIDRARAERPGRFSDSWEMLRLKLPRFSGHPYAWG